jgi:hypothetical protein
MGLHRVISRAFSYGGAVGLPLENCPDPNAHLLPKLTRGLRVRAVRTSEGYKFVTFPIVYGDQSD